jgi:hypothetical protein
MYKWHEVHIEREPDRFWLKLITTVVLVIALGAICTWLS